MLIVRLTVLASQTKLTKKVFGAPKSEPISLYAFVELPVPLFGKFPLIVHIHQKKNDTRLNEEGGKEVNVNAHKKFRNRKFAVEICRKNQRKINAKRYITSRYNSNVAEMERRKLGEHRCSTENRNLNRQGNLGGLLGNRTHKKKPKKKLFDLDQGNVRHPKDRIANQKFIRSQRRRRTSAKCAVVA